MASMIIESYGYYKLTEFMLFFQKFKRGEYGKFYGAVDPMQILQALDEFHKERVAVYIRKEQEKQKAHQAKIDREWEELRTRYRNRVPDAFKKNAPLTFNEYRLLGYDLMDDETLSREIKALQSGEKTVPKDKRENIEFLKQIGMTD